MVVLRLFDTDRLVLAPGRSYRKLKLIKYWIDGYISEYNICIEWDEKGHKYRKEYDEKRETFLKENKDCVFVRIDQKEFLKDIENGIIKTIDKLNHIIYEKEK